MLELGCHSEERDIETPVCLFVGNANLALTVLVVFR